MENTSSTNITIPEPLEQPKLQGPIYTRSVYLVLIAAFYIGFIRFFFNNRYFALIPDILLVLLLAKILLVRPSKWRTSTLTMESFVWLFIFVSFVSIFHPNVPSFGVGIEGFRKTAFYFIALIIGINLNWKSNQVVKILNTILWLGLPLCLYSAKQYFAPSSFDLSGSNDPFHGPRKDWVLDRLWAGSSPPGDRERDPRLRRPRIIDLENRRKVA